MYVFRSRLGLAHTQPLTWRLQKRQIHDNGRPSPSVETELRGVVRSKLSLAMEKAEQEKELVLSQAQNVSQGERDTISESFGKSHFTPVQAVFTSDIVNKVRKPDTESIAMPPRPKVLRAAVLGLENSGKSSLVNNLVGDHVAVVSFCAYATRRWTLGVTTSRECQILLMDTPPITAALQTAEEVDRTSRQGMRFFLELQRRYLCNEASWESLHCADAVVLAVNGRYGLIDDDTLAMMHGLQQRLDALDKKLAVFVAITQLDRHPNPRAVEEMLTSTLLKSSPLRSMKVIGINRKDVNTYFRLKAELALHGIPSKWGFPENQKTDQTLDEIIELSILEKVAKYVPRIMDGNLSSK
ncbi:GTP-binding protein Era, partial [Diplonema papillatum]